MRRTAAEVVSFLALKPDDTATAQAAQRNIARVSTRFQTHTAALESHGHFEETMLFRFFFDTFPAFRKGAFLELSQQHLTIEELEAELTSTFARMAKALSSGEITQLASSLLQHMCAYEEHLLHHLVTEETAILHLWLNLTPVLYTRLQSKYLRHEEEETTASEPTPAPPASSTSPASTISSYTTSTGPSYSFSSFSTPEKKTSFVENPYNIRSPTKPRKPPAAPKKQPRKQPYERPVVQRGNCCQTKWGDWKCCTSASER
jgi:hypothetical protein